MNYNSLTHLYPISKTLRFELKPVAETANYIEEFKSQYLKDIVAQDEQRAEDYKIIKEIIDDYHREYIEEKLSNPCNPDTGELYITEEDFENAFSCFKNFKQNNKDSDAKTNWNNEQTFLREKLVKSFHGLKRLFSKELITQDLEYFLKKRGDWEENKDVVENFKKFTTYFTGFNKNRKNMYSADDKSTTISFRLINENLGRFFKNIILFNKINTKYPKLINSINTDSKLLKRMGVNRLEEIFNAGYYIKLFTQTGITNFNELKGGTVDEDKSNPFGLNNQLNEYRQKKDISRKELPNFIKLYKQILSKDESRSFTPEPFINDQEMFSTLKDKIEKIFKKNGMIDQLKKSLNNLNSSDLDKTFIKGDNKLIRNLSNEIFNKHYVINSALSNHAETLFSKPNQDEKRRKFLKKEVYSISELEKYITSYLDEEILAEIENIRNLEFNRPIQSHFESAIQDKCLSLELDKKIKKIKPILLLDKISAKRRLPKNKDGKGEEGFEQIRIIQEVLNAFMAILYTLKPLHLVHKKKSIDIPDIDLGFYSDFSEFFEKYEKLVLNLYNRTRNYLTKKPFSTDKIKINFENPNLLYGWDFNQAKGNNANIIRKDGLYYLAVMHPGHKKIFDDYPNDGLCFEKINYKQVANPGKDIQNLLFINGKTERKTGGKKQEKIEKFCRNMEISIESVNSLNVDNKILEYLKNTYLPEEINSIRKRRSYSKSSTNFNKDDLVKFIDYYKDRAKDYFSYFSFNFLQSDKYEEFNNFTNHINEQAYQLWFTNISEAYINDCVEQGVLFLFQIYNKDFSKNRTKERERKDNLHTMYWKGLFDSNNLKDVVAKLNGKAEIFFRGKSIKNEDRTVHKAKTKLKNKNENNPEPSSEFPYDIIKDRRYTVDKFLFHVPITLNFKASSKYFTQKIPNVKSFGEMEFNNHINEEIAQSNDQHIIGIDRGERNLIYYTVINQIGEIIEQGSFNKIKTDQNYEVDYHQKLDKKEKERDRARKSWATIENIKELKAGYLSIIVHEISLLLKKYNAIVCLEDLNTKFKQGRSRVEKQVYQKFERALIQKLNYLVFKDAQLGEPGHCLNAFQLTAPFINFSTLFPQTGILYYVRAAYTSKIDPVTGFINLLYSDDLRKTNALIQNMDGVRYNQQGDYFEFNIDYEKLKPSYNLEGYKTNWTICTFGDLRFRNVQNKDHKKWESIPINVTERLKTLFEEYDIQYLDGSDLRLQIGSVKRTNFYSELRKLLKDTLTLRHSKSGTDEDFILSPVADENGNFFDSRTAPETLPQDADANGAYHIALKGLWNIQKIKEWNGNSRLNLAMKNVDWFSFAYQKPFKK